MFKNKDNLRKTISVFLNYNKTDNKDLISNDEYDFIITKPHQSFGYISNNEMLWLTHIHCHNFSVLKFSEQIDR